MRRRTRFRQWAMSVDRRQRERRRALAQHVQAAPSECRCVIVSTGELGRVVLGTDDRLFTVILEEPGADGETRIQVPASDIQLLGKDAYVAVHIREGISLHTHAHTKREREGHGYSLHTQ